MATGQPGESAKRVVALTPQADIDRLTIYIYTEQQWGTVQAENYNAFLQTVMEDLAANPTSGSFVENLPNVKSGIARWKNARHGHRIFFKETETGILVLRIRHTSMNSLC